jgi:hypothetical protein
MLIILADSSILTRTEITAGFNEIGKALLDPVWSHCRRAQKWPTRAGRWVARGGAQEKWRVRRNPPSRIVEVVFNVPQVIAIGEPGEPVAPVIGTGTKT